MNRRVVLLADLDSAWTAIARALEANAIEVDVLSPRTPAADVIACVARAESVLVVDLAPDPARGLAIIVACRRAAGIGPVVAVAANPSQELTRSVRFAGAFYLALQPVVPDEMRAILASAFESIDRRRARTSTCRAVRRILIVDDDQDFVASTTALLEAYGYAVTSAATAHDGLYKARTEHPDLIVLDVMMENDSAGYEVNETVKFAPGFEAIRHIPIVMVSSIEADPATRFSTSEEAPLITPDVYLTKPLDVPRFLREVGALLGESPEKLAGAPR